MRKVYRIHPGIGIARLGNSPTAWLDGPEIPDLDFVPAPAGKYRDANNLVARQAIKFRIYEYTFDDMDHLVTVRQLTDLDAEIQWHVHLANLKSFTTDPAVGQHIPVLNDPGTVTVSGANQWRDVKGRIFGTDVQLGTLATEQPELLRVLGGFGRSDSPSGAALMGLYSPDWFDDVSDGPVRATIRLRATGEMPPVEPAWVVVGVPGYAHPITSIVTMFDLAYDLAVRHFGLAPPREVSFMRDIFPVLQRVVLMQWVDPDARRGHGISRPGNFLDPAKFALLSDNDPSPGSAARMAREDVLARLKNPAGGGGDMPRLYELSLTSVQYEQFGLWASGDFMADWTGIPAVTPFDQLAPLEQTESLDRTSLWSGVGGSFNPGIEVGERFGEASTFERPFRVKQSHPAGYLTATLSIPWQADFQACGTGWWPSARPNSVTADAATYTNWARFAPGDNMVKDWWKLGFVAKTILADGRIAYLETERV